MTAPPNFRSIGAREITAAAAGVQPVRTERLAGHPALPAVLRSESPGLKLSEWAERNRAQIDAELAEAGAVLLRGFDVDPEDGFQRFAAAVGGGGLEYTQRSTRRTKQRDGIYTSTEYPAALTIDLHSENSFQKQWPRRIMFHSVVVAHTGGATPIADNTQVYQRIPAQIRQQFEERQIKYVRNFGAGLELPWQEAFQTDERAKVEEYCRAASITWEWKEDDRLRTEEVLPAIIVLPETGLTAWFNQAHLFHVSNLQPEIRSALLESIGEADLPRHAYFGDGEPIPEAWMDTIRAAYAQCKVSFSWEKDDVMLLDNLRICHGREPFTGPRRVLVSMADPATFSQFIATTAP
jgi:alpha-ketoglutarate-dependent taurine dioxygenase